MSDWSLLDLLPGLYVALLAWLLAAVLRRWFDPLPSRAIAVFGLILILLFGPVLFAGYTLVPVGMLPSIAPYLHLEQGAISANPIQTDVLLQIVPWQALVRQAYRSGEWPLWNDLAGTGEPLLANLQAQHLQPLVLLALPFPLWQAVGITGAVRVLVALVFAFLLFRRQGLGEGPALAGALAYGLGGFLLLWLHWPMGNGAALLPLLLYAVIRAMDRGEGRDLLLLAGATWAVLLGGHPETTAYCLAAAAGLALVRSRPIRERWRPLVPVAGAMILAAGAATPVLLPAAHYLPQSLRYQRLEARGTRTQEPEVVRWWKDGEFRAASLEDLSKRTLPLLAPNAYGNSRFRAYWGRQNTNEDAAGYGGTVALLAALLAFLPCRGVRFPQERLAMATAVVCLVVIAGVPGIKDLFDTLPGLNRSATYHRRLALILSLCLAYLAGCTWERWRRRELTWQPMVGTAPLLGATIAWAYLAHPHPEDSSLLAGLRHGSLALHLGVLAAAALILGLTTSRRWGMPALAGLVAVELLWIHGPANPPMPKSLYFPTPPPLEYLQRHLEGQRFVGVGRTLLANLAALYGLSDLRSFNPIKPGAVVELTRHVTAPESSLMVEDFQRLEEPLYDLLGVRYVLSPRQFQLPGFRRAFRHHSGWIYERPGALERLFLPASTEIYRGGSWRHWIAQNPDFADRALVQASLEHSKDWQARSPEASRLHLEAVTATRLQAQAELAEPCLLASSLYQDGGWRLLVDGEAQTTLLANGPFVAAWLPPGSRRLDLLYRPPGFLAGCLLAALALTAGCLWWLPPSGSVTS